MTEGRIHSIETFGTVDGPGVRLVVFVQGCPMRCAYCHNPDTWSMAGGVSMTPAAILEIYERNRPFYRNGGLTVTGGEPLEQIDFLSDLFSLADRNHIHTCLDTSGISFRPADPAWMKKLDRLLSCTDLVMLDIKHIDADRHRELTGHSNEAVLQFASYLETKQIPMWIRHVVVPGLTDDDASLFALGYSIGAFSNLNAIDVLPYHTMGEEKYRNLGIAYRLSGVPAMDVREAALKKQVILDGIRKRRGIAPE